LTYIVVVVLVVDVVGVGLGGMQLFG